MLIHPVPDLDAKLQLVTDASSVAVVAVLQQNVNDWQPLGFFSHELKNPEQKYHTFPRKLLAVYLDIKHLHYFLEGCNFHVLTDHKSLTFRFQRNHSDHRACEIWHLCFVLEFTVGLGPCQSGHKSTAADSLSRIGAISSADPVDWEELATAQGDDPELQRLRASPKSLKFADVSLPFP